MGLMMTDMEREGVGMLRFCISYLRSTSAGFSAGCTCQPWAEAEAGFLCCPGHPGYFWTAGRRAGC